MTNRIDRAFRKTRAENRAAFMPFITAGDPDLQTTGALIEEVTRRGADIIELGIPYSDPIADGPTIQASFVRALAGGVSVSETFAMVRDVRVRCQVPILTMVSFSIVSKIKPETYFKMAAEAGTDGVIIPDLPPDEGKLLARQASAAGLHPVFLVAPTTHDKRMGQIAKHSKGFIYYISVTGTTGARDELPPDLADHLCRLKAMTHKPIAVGFGISRPDQVRGVAKHADGVIVGSALVRRIHELADKPREELVAQIGDLVARLAAGTGRE